MNTNTNAAPTLEADPFNLRAWLDGCPARTVSITSARNRMFAATMVEHGRIVHSADAEDPVDAVRLLDEVAAELDA